MSSAVLPTNCLKTDKHHLTPDQWALLKAILNVLQPFEEATRLLCKDSASLGELLPLLQYIEDTLQRICIDADWTTTARQLSAGLLAEFSSKKHLCAVKKDVTFWSASLLDPRFRSRFETIMSNSESTAQQRVTTVLNHLVEQVGEHSVLLECRDNIDMDTEGKSSQPCPSSSLQELPMPLPMTGFHLWCNTSAVSTSSMGALQEQDRTEAIRTEFNAYMQDEGVNAYNTLSDPEVY